MTEFNFNPDLDDADWADARDQRKSADKPSGPPPIEAADNCRHPDTPKGQICGTCQQRA